MFWLVGCWLKCSCENKTGKLSVKTVATSSCSNHPDATIAGNSLSFTSKSHGRACVAWSCFTEWADRSCACRTGPSQSFYSATATIFGVPSPKKLRLPWVPTYHKSHDFPMFPNRTCLFLSTKMLETKIDENSSSHVRRLTSDSWSLMLANCFRCPLPHWAEQMALCWRSTWDF